ncbi:uncharacterized protein BDR25DRAFT_347000 [Lindgomyces ingoldianus]|uniref:Uncharacterized protein n=1 Tax=Lindgomyces ingoldianus TaxID=673940 RepID=A0ACB6QB78_9PLEO|nr:uncharacterized protein BDR25DRAFT_347000 [Lindgomyces ingoldianus]KAF2463838.1 hypothetical protein BDR25DRAFT_347000 [Lindgomyces ingoldianus]
MSLESLQNNGLFVILFLRTSPHTTNNFHWGLYLHRFGKRGGTKYHIKQQGAGWITDHGNTAGVFKSFLLVGLFQIATIRDGWEDYVDQQLRTYDSSLNNSPNITCRVWVLWVLALLQKEVNGYKLLKCADLSALEAEIMEWGNANAAAADANQQPRPVAVSKYIQG